ncbi:hypothetical protein ACFSJV_22835 [Paradevosia shaoguanensis]
MPDIELEPRKHSHLYEVKPMSRWWLVPAIGYALLCLAVMGFGNWQAYCALFGGALLMLALLMIFPHYWLSRRD